MLESKSVALIKSRGYITFGVQVWLDHLMRNPLARSKGIYEMPVCRELLSRNPYSDVVDFARFSQLYPAGRQLILRWLSRAERGNDPFEQFMFAWLAFNGWAECVTDSDTDRQYLDVLMQSEPLQQAFAELRQNDDKFRAFTEEFARYWPIFKVRDLRHLGIRRWHTPATKRTTLIQDYLDQGANRFQPLCWQRHRNEGQPVPIDLSHTLAALYQVRCNLFHGEKDPNSEMDWRIVQAAFTVLSTFIRSLPSFAA